MKARQAFFGFLALAAAGACAAAPTIENVQVRREANRLAVSYVLKDEPAVVTVQFQTNGVDLAATDFSEVVGDVATVVSPGARAFAWYASKAAPDLTVGEAVAVVVKAWPTNAPPPFMTVDLTFPGLADRDDGLTNYVDAAGRVVRPQLRDSVRFYASEAMLPGGAGGNCDRYKTDFLLLKKIGAADVTWWMGTPDGVTLHDAEVVRNTDGSCETPHQVTLKDDYYVGVFEVTQAQLSRWSPGRTYRSSWAGIDTTRFPADNISYNELRGTSVSWPSGGHAVAADSVLGQLRGKVGAPGDYPFDLPTEAQWEYAARGGCGAAFQNGVLGVDWVERLPAIDGICRYKGNGGDWSAGKNPKDDAEAIGRTTAVVGSYEPNGFGLYDVHGNVAELCLDYYAKEAYSQVGYNAETGPSAPDAAAVEDRCLRGGFAGNDCNPHGLRLGKRSAVNSAIGRHYFGFRLCCPARAVYAPVPTY